jgi:hypothetical protein
MQMEPWLAKWGCVLASAGLLLTGCVRTQRLVIGEPVGPASALAQTERTTGQLIVYSAWDGLDTLDAEHQKHSPYVVREQQGTIAARVRNRQGSFGEEPEVVSLPPGRYFVEARSTNTGPVQVPVIIDRRRTTVVYLDGVAAPPAALADEETNWIRQPNGLIVGWRDQAGEK